MKHRFRSFLAVLIIAALSSVQMGCGLTLFHGGTAKANAVQALVTTTRMAVALMTAAGIAYDAGAFGAPGGAKAEDTWNKIAAESLRMNTALNGWSAAIVANKDASTYQSMVAQALAVLAALLPAPKHSEILPVIPEPLAFAWKLEHPDQFRNVAFAGGSR